MLRKSVPIQLPVYQGSTKYIAQSKGESYIMAVSLLQRFVAAYVDLKPLDPAATGWVESIVRIYSAAVLTFQWLVCSSFQSPSFPE